MENTWKKTPFMDDFRLEMDVPYLSLPQRRRAVTASGNQVPEVAAMIMISCPIQIIQEPQMINDADSITAQELVQFSLSVISRDTSWLIAFRNIGLSWANPQKS